MRFPWCLGLGLLLTPIAARAQGPSGPIRLVISLVIDQVPPGALDRWRPGFTGGLARLLREGVYFPNAEQDHGLTDTGPGHSTLMSGRFPAHTGIISNELSTTDPAWPMVQSPGTGMSPARFRGTTLVDWLVARDSATRVLAVSTKARGAILMVGRRVAPIFWYDRGIFNTSRYYGDTLPTWVKAWNARDPLGALLGAAWNLSRPADFYPEPDDRPFERGRRDGTFPHRLPTDRVAAASELIYFSPLDSLTLDLALEGARALGLGQRQEVDVMTISLSTNDEIAHEWGPGSRESHDHMLNLDRWLGWFLDSLSQSVPLDQIAITLASDHGSSEFPEAGKGGRLSLSTEVREVNRLGARWGIRAGAVQYGGLILADVAALRARGVNVDSLSAGLARAAEAKPGVRRAYTPRSLAAAPPTDLVAMRWKRHLPADVGWLIAVSVEDNWVWGSSASSTGHKTGNLSDRSIPLLFRVPGVAPARVERSVRSVDLAPTLAALLGVRPTEPIDGNVLPEALRGRSPR